jgi:uncharacterized protein YjgD (DUF1641 family)
MNDAKKIDKLGLTQMEIITICEMLGYLNESLILDAKLNKFVNLVDVFIEMDKEEYLNLISGMHKLINQINN